MDRYNDVYKASFNYYKTKNKQYKKMRRATIWKKRISTLALATMLAVSVNAGSNLYKNQQIKNELMLNTTNQMLDVGYKTVPGPDGSWDQNYYLLKEMDVLGLYALMGKDETEKVLKTMGYTGWEDFLTQEGYADIVEWRKAAVSEFADNEKLR